VGIGTGNIGIAVLITAKFCPKFCTVNAPTTLVSTLNVGLAKLNLYVASHDAEYVEKGLGVVEGVGGDGPLGFGIATLSNPNPDPGAAVATVMVPIPSCLSILRPLASPLSRHRRTNTIGLIVLACKNISDENSK
jgi:hypothetical protein